ncbi:adenylate/guanylate cyclase domain-containing protein [Rhizobium ruizarguesonis]|jgi:class 3 adenylate cyclase|uniref:adenylate/guanylate cyclase domain-containing protein n=1 Tax=Rhizobium ruizarguesonis TaxID=2081791 RepID=UPI00102F52E1|nr:adenylate/guanylate cyclase domain-containing protein [Rhizobium ruizarguesonis]MBY5890999.1 adenylate/guanylate cyclase domain-containing protein [Rhizobium leguminosarum]TCA71222.1 adenylate/guanylate cyclase domain-containing protein [Rhizobium leguminosarum bv. viciae]QSZ01501.1 adenylate/guanylate cyclase domain-containing protein [Rhizobium ruizarguesonis]TAY77629.1 adenylate/guanylate cyclase domain-containing protein [Rhizobium ruizarguesonis]TAZ33108.1 adenylate/guanylate cyclase d
MSEVDVLFAALRQAADPQTVECIENLVMRGSDRDLNRINALAFADAHGLDQEKTIAAFLHAARIGAFEMTWNVLCPGCGGVLDTGATLKTVDRETYHCALCAAGYEPTLDEMVEVTFTVSPRVRRIAAHDPDRLPPFEYYRQIFFSSGVDLPDDLEARFKHIQLEMIELDPGEKAFVSLQLPAQFVIIFDPVTHSAQFIDVQGEPTDERQTLSMVISHGHALNETVTLRPGLLRLTLENHTDRRVVPNVCIAGDELHDILGRRRAFLTAQRLLTNQSFRDIYRTDTLDIDQRLKITSLTFLFTDLRGSTALYERVGDLAAFDLVRAHFRVLHEIVATEAGAVVKTIGDAVMATFPSPDRAVAAALRMREAMLALNAERGSEDLLLKIGIHEGPCLAVSMNDRQDYFGQTVNIASRVQGLAEPQVILTTEAIVGNAQVSEILRESGITSASRMAELQGIGREVRIFALS